MGKRIFFCRPAAWVVCILFLGPLLGFAQDPLEDGAIADSVMKASSYEARLRFNQIFLEEYKKRISKTYKNSEVPPLIPMVSVVSSPDGFLKVHTWVVHNPEKTKFKYFGFIQCRKEGTSNPEVIELADSTQSIQHPAVAKLSAGNWYGAVYYRLVQEVYRKKTIYTLFGWKGKDMLSTIKVMDAIQFRKGKPDFGTMVFPTIQPIKRGEPKFLSRLILEFNAQAIVNINVDNRLGMIVFDHLAPPNPESTGMFSSYGPDFSHDAIRFQKGRYRFMGNVDARSKTAPSGSSGKKKSKEEPVYQPGKK